jgi:hypothetical protein
MWKWLRYRFVWRFSLGRLMIATVFLGAVVGLNLQEIGPIMCDLGSEYSGNYRVCYWGWPLPLFASDEPAWRKWENRYNGDYDDPVPCRLPWTHKIYHLAGGFAALRHSGVGSKMHSHVIICGAIIDALFALTVLSLILFVQIPCRKAPGPVE